LLAQRTPAGYRIGGKADRRVRAEDQQLETPMTIRPIDFLIGALLLTLGAGAHAQQIFKCTDRTGRTTYGDSPCPKGAARATDVTSAVQACTDRACEAQRERDRLRAQARLREDQKALAEATAQRRKADAEYLDQMARLQESQARQRAAERPSSDPDSDRWSYGYGYDYGWNYGWGRPVVRPPVSRPPVWRPGVTPRPHTRLDPIYTSPPVAANTN
jgi:hypothetical protein